MNTLNSNTMILFILTAVLIIFGICGILLATYLLLRITNDTKKKVEPQPTVQPQINSVDLHLNELSFQDASLILNNIITHRVRTLVRREDLGKYDVDTLSVMLDKLVLKLCTQVDTSINTPLRVRLLMFVSDDFLTYYIHDTVQNVLVLTIDSVRTDRSQRDSSRSRRPAPKNASRVANSKGLASGKTNPTTKGSNPPMTQSRSKPPRQGFILN